jgi:hypothetical protein
VHWVLRWVMRVTQRMIQRVIPRIALYLPANSSTIQPAP